MSSNSLSSSGLRRIDVAELDWRHRRVSGRRSQTSKRPARLAAARAGDLVVDALLLWCEALGGKRGNAAHWLLHRPVQFACA